MRKKDIHMTQPVAVRYMRVPDLARRWCISLAHAYRLAGTVLPAIRIGESVRVPLEAIERYERSQLGHVPSEKSVPA